jgi:hypothetical protein
MLLLHCRRMWALPDHEFRRALGPSLLQVRSARRRGSRSRRARHPRRHCEHQPRRHVRGGLQPAEHRSLRSTAGADLRPARGGHRDADRDATTARGPRRDPLPPGPPLQHRFRARPSPRRRPSPSPWRRRRPRLHGVGRGQAGAAGRGRGHPGVGAPARQAAPHVPGRQEVGAVHLGVAARAEERRVRGAVHGRRAPAELAPRARCRGVTSGTHPACLPPLPSPRTPERSPPTSACGAGGAQWMTDSTASLPCTLQVIRSHRSTGPDDTPPPFIYESPRAGGTFGREASSGGFGGSRGLRVWPAFKGAPPRPAQPTGW